MTTPSGLFTQLATLIDQIHTEYTSLSDRSRKILRRKGFERRHITSLLKIKEAMVTANFLITSKNPLDKEAQGSLF